MPDLNTPYLERSPGDLITAEDWNDLQRRVRRDIGETTQKAVDELTRVAAAGNADKLEGKTLSEVTDEVIRRAVQEIRAESGYQQLFRVLRQGEDNVVKHALQLSPLVDVYQLDYFQVVCCEDKDTYPTWTTFHLQHKSEESVRYAKGTTRGSLRIQPERGPRFLLPFREMLSRYHVDYDDDSSLSDVENDFWETFNSDPNDRFSDDQYCHSPWFDKCCREEKSVGDAKRSGDWDDLFIQMRPRKTINYPGLPSPANERPTPTPAPNQVQVTHYDFDTLGLTLVGAPIHPALADEPSGPIEEQIPGAKGELKVMVLLKV